MVCVSRTYTHLIPPKPRIENQSTVKMFYISLLVVRTMAVFWFFWFFWSVGILSSRCAQYADIKTTALQTSPRLNEPSMINLSRCTSLAVNSIHLSFTFLQQCNNATQACPSAAATTPPYLPPHLYSTWDPINQIVRQICCTNSQWLLISKYWHVRLKLWEGGKTTNRVLWRTCSVSFLTTMERLLRKAENEYEASRF